MGQERSEAANFIKKLSSAEIERIQKCLKRENLMDFIKILPRTVRKGCLASFTVSQPTQGNELNCSGIVSVFPVPHYYISLL